MLTSKGPTRTRAYSDKLGARQGAVILFFTEGALRGAQGESDSLADKITMESTNNRAITSA
jgi:hypothetical protein